MTVDEVMAARGVGRKFAYTLLRRAHGEAMSAYVPPANQRNLVLVTLLRRGEDIRNSNELADTIVEEGAYLSNHDATKVLWSLQKSHYVKFRERSNGLLYAIRLTGEGQRAARAVMNGTMTNGTAPAEEPVEQPVEEGTQFELPPIIDAARHLQETINELGAGAPTLSIDLTDFPYIRALLAKAEKHEKLIAIAEQLEALDEEATALELANRFEFNDVEHEVIALVRRYTAD